MKFNKKALTWSMLIPVIIAVISILVVIFNITSVFDSDVNYDNSIFECSRFLKSVKGLPMFWTELSEPSPKLINSVKSLCPSKTVSISDDNTINNAYELIHDCWAKSGRGVDFIGKNVDDSNFVLYCGDINVKEDVEDFNEKLYKILIKEDKDFLFNSTSSENINSLSLSAGVLPSKLESGDKLSVFFTIFVDEKLPSGGEVVVSWLKGLLVFNPSTIALGSYIMDGKDFENIAKAGDLINTGISKTVASAGVVGEMASYFSTGSSFSRFSGILLVNNLESKVEDGQVIGFENLENMNIIIPEKNYD